MDCLIRYRASLPSAFHMDGTESPLYPHLCNIQNKLDGDTSPLSELSRSWAKSRGRTRSGTVFAVPGAGHTTFRVSPPRGSVQTHSLHTIIFPLSAGRGGLCGEEEREGVTQMAVSPQVIQKVWATLTSFKTQGEGQVRLPSGRCHQSAHLALVS